MHAVSRRTVDQILVLYSKHAVTICNIVNLVRDENGNIVKVKGPDGKERRMTA